MFKKRKLDQRHYNRQRREAILPSKLLNHPLLGGLSLRSKLGEATRFQVPRSPNENVAAYYAASLSEKVIYNAPGKVSGLVVDETKRALIFARCHDEEGSDTLYALRYPSPRDHFGQPNIFEAMPYSFEDMSISAKTQKLLYVSNSPQGTRTVLLDLPKDGDDPHVTGVDLIWHSTEETAWQTAASPTGKSFAVVSTNGLCLYEMRPDQISRVDWVKSQTPASSEFMAVTFGRNDRTIMAGKRSGIVAFFDSRSQDSVARLRHVDGVSAVRMIDNSRIVVRGLQKVCCSQHESQYPQLFERTQPQYPLDY